MNHQQDLPVLVELKSLPLLFFFLICEVFFNLRVQIKALTVWVLMSQALAIVQVLVGLAYNKPD